MYYVTYNYIRINEVIKKANIHNNFIYVKKSQLKEEIKKTDSHISEHTYKIKKEKIIEDTITLNEILENLTLQQLREYRDFLGKIKKYNNIFTNCGIEKEALEFNIPTKENNQLSLVLKLKKNHSIK